MSQPPAELGAIASLVDQRVRQVLADEQQRWASTDQRLVEAIAELERMSLGGKRLRAAFCYWTWAGAHLASGGVLDEPGAHSTEMAIDAGAAFELLQTFALIHDDVMDDADTRRGETTIHVKAARRLEAERWKGEPRRYGEGVAILVGDLAHVYADRLLTPAPVAAQLVWDELRIELNLGQYLDMRAAASGTIDRETAQRVATFKTALYTIVRPMQVGALLANDGQIDQSVLDAIDAFGRPVGQAFQLRDDLLGVLGDRERVGKPVGDDLREGKATELVAVALERATAEQRETLSTIGKRTLSDAEVGAIVDIFDETGAVAEIESRIDDLTKAATDAAADLPFEAGVRSILVSLANYVASRTH